MSDHKTKEQLISELAKLRKQISSIESNEFEEKRRKNKLLENELLNNAIIKDSPIGISIRDKNGTLLLANKAWRDIWQVTNKDILEYSQLKKKLTLNEKDLYLGEHQEAIKQLYKTGGKYFIPEIKLLKERKNKAKWISQHFYAVNGKKGEINRVVILTENITKHKNIEMELQQHKENLEKIIVERTAKLQKEITERKKAEQVLASYQEHLEQVVRERTSDLEIAKENIEKSEKMYRTLTDNLNVGIYRNTAGSKGRFIEVNPAIIKMFGYKNREEFLAINVAELYENSKERSKYSNKLIKLGSVKDEEIKLRKKNSEIFIGSVSAVSIKDKNGKVLFYDGIIEDITDRKRGEEALRNSEEKYRAVFENTGTATIIIEENDLISHTNQEFEKLSGYRKEEIEWKKKWTEFVQKKDLSKMQDQHKLRRIDPFKALKNYEFHFIDKQNNIRDIYVTVDVLPGTKKQIASLLDITERKIFEHKIEKELNIKEMLLKEVNHRVKNNMQLIRSMVNLQSRQITDEKALSFCKDIQNRVQTMSLIHQGLYKSEDFSHIDFNYYIERLASNLCYSYGKSQKDIKLNFHFPKNIDLNINTAIPCGLLLNELISNSLKYAFPENAVGEIHISMKKNDEKYELTMGDNGIGLPENINYTDTKTTGFHLVHALISQLHGTIEMKNKNGVTYMIRFKELEDKSCLKIKGK